MGKAGKHTLEEIHSQPQTWRKTLALFQDLSEKQLPEMAQNLDQVLVSGCGSTHYLSIWAARAIQESTGLVSVPVPSSELWLSPENWFLPKRNQLLVPVSRSGTTTETINAVKTFTQAYPGETFVVSCYPDAELARIADGGLYVPHAQEQSIAQTRSFTNMMLGAAYLVEQQVREDIPQTLASRAEALQQRWDGTMREIAQDDRLKRFFFLGSGRRYGLASETMLKMKEMSLSYSEAYSFLEFRHGPMSMVTDQSLVIGLLDSVNYPQEIKVLQDMKELGAQILALGSENIKPVPEWIDTFISFPVEDLGIYADVLYLPPLQMLAFERALANELDPDNPANLSAVIVL
jgi:glucosamine--fructose-6-phosphate aminotransferase (isomerizing)